MTGTNTGQRHTHEDENIYIETLVVTPSKLEVPPAERFSFFQAVKK
jgi:hypothetical protein